MRERRTLLLALLTALLIAASALCVGMVELRTHQTGDASYRFLDWNLFLAWLPVAFAIAADWSSRRGLAPLTVSLGVLWLLFFPNAPYMVTDFVHLADSAAPLWYDGLVLSSFATTALVLGFVSVTLMQAIWRTAAGPGAAWAGVVGAFALASVGVYIGRFVGYNSWDALLHPRLIAHVLGQRLANPLGHPRRFGALAALTGGLTVAYAVFTAITLLPTYVRRAPLPGTRTEAGEAPARET